MADPRFFSKAPSVKAKELAALLGCEIIGDGETMIENVASLAQARAGDVSFFEAEKYIEDLQKTQASAVILHQDKSAQAAHLKCAFVSQEPYKDFARAVQIFYPDEQPARHVSGMQELAIHPSAQIEDNVDIAIGVVIGPNAEIGAGTKIAANSVIGEGCVIGRDCRIGANVTISHTLMGDQVYIHPQVSIGQDGFGFAPDMSGHVKIPQLGRVIIQNNVEIGAGTMIDRGGLDDTIIGEGTKIDNLCHIAHNVVIGRHCFFAGQSGVAGSTHIGDFAFVGGKVGISGHLSIGQGVKLQGASVVTKDLPDGAHVSGYPARDVQTWRKQEATLARLAKSKDKNKTK
ncbi:MAG: UDP-3-O-(3-hydroxymyristoyl)glucosamine N-acyltransferase [Parvibaculales bacterium]